MKNEERFSFLEKSKYFHNKAERQEREFYRIKYTFRDEETKKNYCIHVPYTKMTSILVNASPNFIESPEWFQELYWKVKEEVVKRDSIRKELEE